MGPRPDSIEDMSMDDIGIECLKFKKSFWYPEMMSNESHWVPIAEDPSSCIGDQSLYEVKSLAIIFIVQENVETTLKPLSSKIDSLDGQWEKSWS